MRRLARAVHQVDLDSIGAVRKADPLGQAQVTQEAEHPHVLRQDERVEPAHTRTPRYRDQSLGQREPESTPLPGIGDDGSVLGTIGARLAVEPDDRHQLARSVRIQRHQGVPLVAVNLGRSSGPGPR